MLPTYHTYHEIMIKGNAQGGYITEVCRHVIKIVGVAA